MSDDPFRPERRPSDYSGMPPRDRPQGDPYAPAFGEGSDPKKAKGRLVMPGILIVLVGVLDLLPAGCCGGVGIYLQEITVADFEKVMNDQNPKQYADLQKQGVSFETFKKSYSYSGLSIGVVSLVTGFLALVGGGFMIAGRSRFLCFVGALAAIFSPGGGCVLGLAIGIWAFIVLFSEDVRAAFRAS